MADDIDRLILQMSADMRRMEKSMDKGRQKVNRATRQIENRFEDMNRNIARSSGRLGNVLSRAFGPLLAGATITALGRTATAALAAGEAIGDMAGRANTSAEFLQELRYVSSQTGAETRDFDDAISRLNRRLGLFLQDGAGPAANAFRRLGLDSRIANGELRNSEDVFNAAVRAMQGIENQAERSAIASQLFGEDSGPRLVQLMSLGTEAMAAQRQEARDLGLVMSNELVRDAGEASDALERMRMQFSSRVNISIAENADELENLAEMLARVATAGIDAAAAVANAVQSITQIETVPEQQRVSRRRSDLFRDIERQRARVRQLEEHGPGPLDMIFGGDRDAPLQGARSELRAMERELAQLEEQLERLRRPSPGTVVWRGQGDDRQQFIVGDDGVERAVEDSNQAPPVTGLDRSRSEETAEEAARRSIENARAREAADNEAWLRRHNERIALQRIEIENEIELARLRGDDEEVRRLERELELQERINALVGSGVAFRDAQASAGAHLDAAELARQQGEYREFFRSAFKDGMLAALDGNAGEALSAWWRSYVSRALSGVLDRLADTVFDAISNAGSGGTGGLLSRVGNWFGGFFAQGGTMTPGQYGYAGEAGMERIDALPGGGVKITPVGGVGRAQAGQVVNILQKLHLHAEGAVMTEDLLAEMDAKAVNAARGAVAVSRGDMARAAARQGKRLR